MTREDKILEILALAGVAPRDFSVVRKNYEGLSDEEIDHRLVRLQDGAARMRSWRATQYTADVGRVEGSAVAVMTAPLVEVAASSALADHEHTDALSAAVPSHTELTSSTARMIEYFMAEMERSDQAINKRLRTLTGLVEYISRWKFALGERFALSLQAQIAHLAIVADDSRPTTTLMTSIAALRESGKSGELIAGFVANKIAEMTDFARKFETVTEKTIDSVIKIAGGLHPLMKSGTLRLSTTETVNALARVENAISVYRPTIIVAVNEGSTIADLVISDLKLHTPRVLLKGIAATDFIWEKLVTPDSERTVICVVGHVAKTGETMSRALAAVRRQFSTQNVFGVVLASSSSAAARISQESPFLFHQVSDGTDAIQLAFDASKGLISEDNSFLLRSSNDFGIRTLPVNRSFLEIVRKEISEEFPLNSPAW